MHIHAHASPTVPMRRLCVPCAQLCRDVRAAGMHVGIALKPGTAADLVFPYVDAGLVDMVCMQSTHIPLHTRISSTLYVHRALHITLHASTLTRSLRDTVCHGHTQVGYSPVSYHMQSIVATPRLADVQPTPDTVPQFGRRVLYCTEQCSPMLEAPRGVLCSPVLEASM